MVKRINGISILLLSLLAGSVNAQRRKSAVPQNPIRATRTDTTIKGTTLEVYQVYQPELKPVVKPELSPTLPPVAKEPGVQQYEVPQQTLYYSYRSLPLRPLALGKDTGALPLQNYALLGGGNLSTMLAELGLGRLQGTNWNATVQGRYLAQEGNLENQLYRNFRLNGAGTYSTITHFLDAGLDVRRSVFGRYGYDHDALHFSRDDVRMKYDAASVTLGLRNAQPGPWEIAYHPQLKIGAFDAHQGHENTLNIYLPATRQIDSALSIQFAINGQFAWTTIGNVSGTNHMLQFAPALDYHADNVRAHVGLYPTIVEGDALQLMPDIHADYKLPESKLAIAAGWQAQRIQNTLQQLTTLNPYVLPGNHDRVQSQRNEVFGAANLGIGKHMNVWGRVAWQRYNILPLFVTQPGGDGKDFAVLYDENVKAIIWGGGIRYTIAEDFTVGAEGLWYNFYHQDLYSHVYGEPAVRLKGDASLRIVEGLILTTYAEVLDKIWARNATGQDVQQRGVFDFGASGEYTFASRLSVFLRAENLLGRRNERWLGYPSFGFNLYGGLRFRF